MSFHLEQPTYQEYVRLAVGQESLQVKMSWDSKGCNVQPNIQALHQLEPKTRKS